MWLADPWRRGWHVEQTVDQLVASLHTALSNPATQDRLAGMGLEILPIGPE